jgi:glycosyltransferase involved in cell wall biosynthesis
MSSAKFTFCVPNLNKIQYLPACIESILNQDCQDWRCVFVDGYSTDGSWEYMQQFASDPRFLLLRGKQQGMYEDWNECLRHVETEYFYFLTSDDTCFPALVSTTVSALDACPDIDVCHFQFAYIDAAGMLLRSHEAIVRTQLPLYCEVNQSAHRRSGLCEFMMHFIYRTLYITITSLVFRRNLISKMQGFSSAYGAVGDYDWTMRLGLFSDVLYVPKLLATWRLYEEQATQQDCFSPQVTEKLLAIAQDNLDVLSQMNQANDLKQPINTAQILSNLSGEHALGLYKQIGAVASFSNALKSTFTAVKKYPAYPAKYIFKKISERIDPSKLRPFYYKNTAAHKLIHDYGLQWPPTPVEIQKHQSVLR